MMTFLVLIINSSASCFSMLNWSEIRSTSEGFLDLLVDHLVSIVLYIYIYEH